MNQKQNQTKPIQDQIILIITKIMKSIMKSIKNQYYRYN